MKNRNFVNLNVNPCKMCMPLGAAIAFKGIENSSMLLHGSQGCSTYIRRHMAEHYNEPVDIGSSSLSEQGTVYGGENNLKKGLTNIIKVYKPDIIGVATTCLAETIGEDIKRITDEFKNENSEKVEIIPVSTPGYGATQFEGYFATLTAIVKGIAKDTRKNNKINVITANLCPGDIRNIKEILDSFGVEYCLLPDISETLDSPYNDKFTKIPSGGTKVRDIREMAGSIATIELGVTVGDEISPGKYLEKKYGVQLYKCAVPIGIDNTDEFLKILSSVTGRNVPEKYMKDRGRFVDGMIDSHKYNAEGRAVIFGEPEVCYAISKLCFENGIKPVLISTGSQTEKLRELIEREAQSLEDKPLIIDDTDFETIQAYAKSLKANILIGNSDGKVITEKEGIPLVRIGFPIHDRIGGQRLVYTGYNGSLKLLDDITNTLLEKKYESYRKNTYEKYFAGKNEGIVLKKREIQNSGKAVKDIISEKTKTHPCFSGGACENARMHIPVAPACNISCNYCNRKYDCVNESRPGVTSEVLSPEEAQIKFIKVKEKLNNLKVVGIAGPGDALANFENTKRSIELIKEIDNSITFCLSTNGLMLPFYANEIVELGVSHVTITINTLNPKIGAKLYKNISYLGKNYEGEEAAKILIKNQIDGLTYLASKGIICKVNIVMVKGVNDEKIEDVVKKVKECGAFITNIMPLIPAKGSVFEDMPLTSNKELNELRKKCGIHLQQMYHCKQCRADAIGKLGNDISSQFREQGCGGCGIDKKEIMDENRIEKAYTFAIASKSGLLIDQHFGHANEFYIYRYQAGKVEYLRKESVNKYCSGEDECDSEDFKIRKIIKAVENCDAVLVLRIGYAPSRKLEEKGIKVIQTCGRIEDGIVNAYKELKLEGNEKCIDNKKII